MKKLIIMLLLALPTCLFAQKFAHFNLAEIAQQMPETKAMQTDIEKLKDQYEKELKSMQDELQKKAKDYETAKDSLPENIRKRREEDLNTLYGRIQETFQQNQQSLQETGNEKMQAIQQKIYDAVKSVADAGGYMYVFNMAEGVPFYVNTALSKDLTAEIKAKLGLK